MSPKTQRTKAAFGCRLAFVCCYGRLEWRLSRVTAVNNRSLSKVACLEVVYCKFRPPQHSLFTTNTAATNIADLHHGTISGRHLQVLLRRTDSVGSHHPPARPHYPRSSDRAMPPLRILWEAHPWWIQGKQNDSSYTIVLNSLSS